MKKIISVALAILTVFLLLPAGSYNTADAAGIAQVNNVVCKSVTADSVSLSWDKVGIADGYYVYSYDSSKSEYSKIITVSTNSCKITNLKSATTYKYAVQAYAKISGINICGAKSSILTVKTASASSTPTISFTSTSKAANQQTLTAVMTDDKSVKGYYWGKNSKYTSNTYTSVTAKAKVTKTFTIKSAGKYYLTVKDSDGKIKTASVTYYKTILKANGGTCNLSYTINKSGDSVTLPVAQRSKYNYGGWALKNNATSGKKAITVTSSKTYYAVWISSSKWVSTDAYSFTNSRSNFQKTQSEGYTIKSSDYSKLKSYIKDIYSGSSTYANYVINNVESLKNKTWGGSCYGMAATALLEKAGKTNLRKNYYGGADTMKSVSSPNSDSNVKSAINYYFLSQAIPATRESNYSYKKTENNWESGLKKLVTETAKGNTAFFCFIWSGSGHAVAITEYGGKDYNGNYILYTYDNNYPTIKTYVKISSNYRNCYVSEYGCYPERVEYSFSLEGLNLVDIDGPKNDMKKGKSTYNGKIRTTLMMPSTANMKIVNAEGKTLIVKNGNASGTMKIYSLNDIIGSGNSTLMVFAVDDSKSFTVTSPTKKINISVLTEKSFNCVNVGNADKVVISGGKATVYGKNIDYNIEIPINKGQWDMIKITGVSSSGLSCGFSDSKLSLKGIDPDKVTIKIYYSDGSVKSIKLSALKKIFSITT